MKLSRKDLKLVAKFCRLYDYPYNIVRSTIKTLDDVEGEMYMGKIKVFVQSQAELKQKVANS